MDENLNQQNQQKTPGEGNAPTPPTTPPTPPPRPPQISIRTMESDLKSLEQGGGEMLAQQSFTPPGFQFGNQAGAAKEEPNIEAELNVSGYSGPEKAIFSPAVSAPQPPIREPEGFVINPSRSGAKSWKVILIIIGILIIAVGFGLLGYFVVSSWIFPKQMPAVQ